MSLYWPLLLYNHSLWFICSSLSYCDIFLSIFSLKALYSSVVTSMLDVTTELYKAFGEKMEWKYKMHHFTSFEYTILAQPHLAQLDISEITSFLTLPTYWGSDPMYSSRTKNWFHTHPLLTLCNLPFCPLVCAVDMDLWDQLSPGQLWFWAGCTDWRGAGELFSNRKHRNSSRVLLFSIGQSGRVPLIKSRNRRWKWESQDTEGWLNNEVFECEQERSE